MFFIQKKTVCRTTFHNGWNACPTNNLCQSLYSDFKRSAQSHKSFFCA